MNTLVIYDETGHIIITQSGSAEIREPIGVPFLWVEVPEGKHVTSVDVSVTPHQAILEDIPPTQEQKIEQLRLDMARSNTELFETMLELNGGA